MIRELNIWNIWPPGVQTALIISLWFVSPLQILLKGWSTRASFWTEITAAPFSTLETTRTLASVTLLCVVLRVSALFVHVIIWQIFLYWRLISFFFRDYLLFLLEKPRGRVSFRCSLRRKSYLQRLLRLHQHLRRVRGVLHSRQQLQMEGQNRSRSRYCEWMNISQALMRNVFWFIYKCIFLFSTINC